MKFNNGDREIRCKTVGDVINALKQIDSDIEIYQGSSIGVNVQIVHDSDDEVYIEFEEL